MLETGTGKADITAFKPGVGMMGYGMYHNRVKGVETPLYARTVVFHDNTHNTYLVFVNTETCFISTAVKRGVIKLLVKDFPDKNLSFKNVMLTAQHTHSGPGGYTKYGFYNLTIPGFVPFVYQTIVDGIIESIQKAFSNLQPSVLTLTSGIFEADKEVAFNRSMKAYNNNPDVVPLTPNDHHIAIDRDMQLLKIETPEGKPIACVNWFGVHTTSISNDNTKICSDNKGYAAQYLEDYFKKNLNAGDDFIAIFAQEAAGDVSPNFIWDRKKQWTRGKFVDDYESAKFNGNLQHEKALEIWRSGSGEKMSHYNLDCAYNQVNFTNVVCNPEFTGGKENLRTGSPSHGVAFFKGTKEGPGLPAPLGFFADIFSDILRWYDKTRAGFRSKEEKALIEEKYNLHFPKKILAESGEMKILGTSNVKNLMLPSWADPSIRILKTHSKRGSLNKNPWVPKVLPLQLFQLGELAIVGIPAEITVVGGRRMRKFLSEILQSKGIKQVILSPYANAYCGYITTPEEYEIQCYEGGHTVYGKYTLPAFQTKFKELANDLLLPPDKRKLQPDDEPVYFSDEEIQNRSFSENEI